MNTNIAEATRTRPTHLSNTGYHFDADVENAFRNIYSAGMDPVELAGHLMEAMRRNQLYVIPYPEMRQRLLDHFEAVLAAFPPPDSDAEGVTKRHAAMLRFVKERQAIEARRK